MKKIELSGTPAQKDIERDGQAVLVLKCGIPQLLIYTPDGNPFYLSQIKIPENPAERQEVLTTTEVWQGSVCDTIFTCKIKTFPPDL